MPITKLLVLIVLGVGPSAALLYLVWGRPGGNVLIPPNARWLFDLIEMTFRR